MIPRDLPGQIAHLYQRLGEIERRARNRKRTGVIEEGPDDQGRYRVKLTEGDGTTPFMTGWIKPKTVSAGGTKIDVVYTAGEQVDVTSESGDLTDAVIDFSTYSDSNARANSSNSAVHLTNGGTTVEIADGTVTITTPNVKMTADVEITGDVTITGPVTITGASLTHNGLNVGSTHVHGGVSVGGADTVGPH
jgi:phage baseplate assembly protein gpV